jgi:hypothetical protein
MTDDLPVWPAGLGVMMLPPGRFADAMQPENLLMTRLSAR